VLSSSCLGHLTHLTSLEVMDNELTGVEEGTFHSLNLSNINLAGKLLSLFLIMKKLITKIKT
jgi:hypothetical protein